MDFEKRFIEKVKYTIKEYSLFSKDDKLLLAISGGKDSVSLAYALYKLGYNFDLLFIDLNIPNFQRNLKRL